MQLLEMDGPLESSVNLSEELAVQKWLEGLGMGEHTALFHGAEVDMSILPFFREKDCTELGVKPDRHCQIIAEACQRLNAVSQGHQVLHPPAQSNVECSPGSLVFKGLQLYRIMDVQGEPECQQVPHSPLASNCNTSRISTEKHVEVVDLTSTSSPKQPDEAAAFHCKRKHQTTITEYLGNKYSKERTVVTRPVRKEKDVKRQKLSGKWLPEWQRVPGTSFIVDRFKSIWGVQGDTWFLTHFHADHYGGLTKSFSHGLIYCSPVTARLVHSRLKVPMNRLVETEVGKAKCIKGVKVTFLDANHCPGANMIFFEPPNAPSVLHTGDCRLVQSMQLDPLLQTYRKMKPILVLDTTYCNPKYCFPSQSDVIRFVVDAVKSEAFSQDVLFLFGTYTIGKERVFMEAAKTLNKKVYVSSAKLQVMKCLDLSPEEKEMMTTNHDETNIHAVQLSLVRTDSMQKLLKRYRGKYTKIVGFQPTGWTFTKNMGRQVGKRRGTGAVVLYQVPYSEHSSFNELVEFVRWFDPQQIIPSVGNDRGQNAKEMVTLLRQRNIQTLMGAHKQLRSHT